MNSEQQLSSSLDRQLDLLDLNIVQQPQQMMNIYSLSHNNSLDLVRNTSIDNAIPISQTMLSRSEDAFHPQHRQYQQKSPKCTPKSLEEELNVLGQLQDIDTFNFKNILPSDHPDYKAKQDNKNVLRNFGNAQNHYVLYNKKARQYINLNIDDVEAFDEWIRSLKLQNFEQFKSAWTDQKVRLFTRVYKQLCWEFYTFNAIPYVLSSRIKKSQTRLSHLRQIHRFLEGLSRPEQFICFKKQ